MKLCSKCKKQKLIKDFYKRSSIGAKIRPECRVCSLENNKIRYSKEYNTIQCRKWAQNNRKKSRAIKKKHQDNNLNCRLRMALRNRLYQALARKMSDVSAIRHLGCSAEQLKSYLESLFKPGMTWDNWSLKGWHIDHIKPLSKFDLKNSEQAKLACHYTNLQPLWAKENQSKWNKI